MLRKSYLYKSQRSIFKVKIGMRVTYKLEKSQHQQKQIPARQSSFKLHCCDKAD